MTRWTRSTGTTTSLTNFNMLEQIIIDIKKGTVFDNKGNSLGHVGDTKTEINTDKAMVYMSVNLIMPAAEFRKISDAAMAPAKPKERAIRL